MKKKVYRSVEYSLQITVALDISSEKELEGHEMMTHFTTPH